MVQSCENKPIASLESAAFDHFKMFWCAKRLILKFLWFSVSGPWIYAPCVYTCFDAFSVIRTNIQFDNDFLDDHFEIFMQILAVLRWLLLFFPKYFLIFGNQIQSEVWCLKIAHRCSFSLTEILICLNPFRENRNEKWISP